MVAHICIQRKEQVQQVYISFEGSMSNKVKLCVKNNMQKLFNFFFKVNMIRFWRQRLANPNLCIIG